MSSRLAKLRIVDAVLTALAVGYSNADYIADGVFPLAPTPKESFRIPRWNKQAFKMFSTERALRAKSNVLNPDDGDWITGNLTEHDLAVPLDYREGEEAAASDLDLEAANTVLAQEGIFLRREKLSADIAFNPGNYAAGNKVVLTGTANQFDLSTGDPSKIVSVGKEAVRRSIARNPNTLVMGASVRAALKQNPNVLSRMPSNSNGVVTDQFLKDLFEVDQILVGNAIYTSDDGNSSFDVWNDSMLLCYQRRPQANAGRNAYEPNYGYTLYKNVEGMKAAVDKYMAEGNKVEFVRSTMRFAPVLTGADGGYLITDCVSTV